MDKLPTHVVEAIKRDAQRQEQHAYEAADKLRKYVRETVSSVEGTPSEQQLNAIQSNITAFLTSIIKLHVDAAKLNSTIESLDDEA